MMKQKIDFFEVLDLLLILADIFLTIGIIDSNSTSENMYILLGICIIITIISIRYTSFLKNIRKSMQQERSNIMSMSTSIVYGYGFPIGDITVETINKFLEAHTDKIPNYKTMEECKENLQKYLPEYYTCSVSGQEGVGAVISNIMREETGIQFEYQPSMQEYSDDSPAILFSECMPWFLSEKEKELTQDSLLDIMTPYMKELGISTETFDEQKIEYWG